MRNPVLYDAILKPFERLRLGQWRRRAFEDARGSILEIGAGTGATLQYYQCAERVAATDPSYHRLRRAVGRAAIARPTVRLAVADGMALPFKDAVFDTVTIALALCTVPVPERTLREALRVLRPGGELRVLEHIRHRRLGLARLQDWLTPAWCRISGGCRLNRPTVETILACGFASVELHHGMGGWLVAGRFRPTADDPTPAGRCAPCQPSPGPSTTEPA
ncbi:MAG: class I SAM-dependent methyltransferase [Chthonomonadales bacterium]|nr:class I SAM-dependent methyltransferase [Chthonomonadales bacterium]